MYKKKAHIHFVGIGGIGMSGIAKILRFQGYTISGCDINVNKKSIEDLKKINCSIFKGNNTQKCQDSTIDILVYSSAIKNNNKEILQAQKLNIPTIPRALMLAELMRTKYSLAIAGSHGKTTTTSLTSHILIEAGIDPTVIIGGHLKNISTNARFGKSDFLVAEADESDKSLLHLQSTLAVITNIDLEHLETYKNIEEIKKTFKQFLNNLPFYGKAILCIDDPHIKSILPLNHINIIRYGTTEKADIYAKDIILYPNYSIFQLYIKNKTKTISEKISISIPGKHNILNCLAAIALSLELNVPVKSIKNALKSFQGIERRFSYNGLFKGAEVFDDYGHHPTEIMHTLKIAKKRAKKDITVIFQPHRYTRTAALWDNFINVFANNPVKNLIITDIYSANEKPINNITSKKLVNSIKKYNPNINIKYIPSNNNFELIKNSIKAKINENDLILLLGAGKINKLFKNIE